MAQNYGLDQIWPPLTEDDVKNLQAIPNQGNGLSDPKKGYNEFVIYGQEELFWNSDLEQKYYYFYQGMTWQNAAVNLPVTEQGTGYGLFI